MKKLIRNVEMSNAPCLLYLDDYHCKKYIGETQLIIDTFNNRISPVFDNIEAEADKVSNDIWDEFMQTPIYGDEYDYPTPLTLPSLPKRHRRKE